MASRPQDSPAESETVVNQSSQLDFDQIDKLYPEDIAEVYDEVLHIADSSSDLFRWSEMFADKDVEYSSVGDELAPRDNYDSDESVVLYDEFDSDDVLVILTGQDGDSLPHFGQLGLEEMEEKGNWWDNLLDQGADYLMDRWSYQGAVRIPMEAEVGTTKMDGRGEMHYVTDQK